MGLPYARLVARARTFPVALALIALAGVTIRVLHTLFVAPAAGGLSDAFWYSLVAQNISAGRGFVTPVGGLFTESFHYADTAQHPPLYPLVLALADTLGITGDTAPRLLGALFGGATVAGVGLLGRRVGGPAVGLLGAALAALYPLLIVADGALLSETLFGPIVAFTLLAAWRLGEEPTVRWAALVGLGIGLAALTRSEALLLLPLLALPLAWRGGGGRARWLRLGAAGACAAVVLAPWVVRNWIVFDRPLMSTNEGTTIAWTNCDETYYGPNLGYKAISCQRKVSGNEAEQSSQLRRAGVDYARDHASRLPVVVAARLAGTWSLYKPFRVEDPGRSEDVVRAGVLFFYPLAALALVGLFVLRRRGAVLIVLVAPFVVVSLTGMATYGSLRGRYLAEIPLVVLAAVGGVAVLSRIRDSRAPERASRMRVQSPSMATPASTTSEISAGSRKRSHP